MKPLELQIASWKDDDGPHNISASDYRDMAARKDTQAMHRRSKFRWAATFRH